MKDIVIIILIVILFTFWDCLELPSVSVYHYAVKNRANSRQLMICKTAEYQDIFMCAYVWINII